MNRWILTEELRTEYKPTIEGFISKVKDYDIEGTEKWPEIDLTDTKLNASTIEDLLKELGFERGDMDMNGWEMDFWIPFYDAKEGLVLTLSGCGYTREIKLILAED